MPFLIEAGGFEATIEGWGVVHVTKPGVNGGAGIDFGLVACDALSGRVAYYLSNGSYLHETILPGQLVSFPVPMGESINVRRST